jgi:NAD(P)-dependent dehydrogenase (short-subunit alcohol dehydrogenase family)
LRHYLTAFRSGNRPELITQTVRDVFEVHVTGTVHLFNLFLPLIQKGNAKKIIATTSGHSADGPTREFHLEVAPLYAASKAAQNTIVAKYHAEFAPEGILFLAVAPGTVDVGQFGNRVLPFLFRVDRVLLIHGFADSYRRGDAEARQDDGEVYAIRARLQRTDHDRRVNQSYAWRYQQRDDREEWRRCHLTVRQQAVAVDTTGRLSGRIDVALQEN